MQKNHQNSLMPEGLSQRQRFKIPEAQFQANDTELNRLKKRMLANSYDQQINNRQLQIRKQTPASTLTKGSSQNPESGPYSPSYMDINTMQVVRQRAQQKILAKDYEEQMNKKLTLQKQQQQEKKFFQKKMIRNLQQMQIKQLERQRRAQLRYRKQFLEHLQSQKKKKQLQRKQKEQQKLQYAKKFSEQLTAPTGNLSKSINPTSISILNTPYRNNKVSKFKQHYDNVNQKQYQIFKNFVDNWGVNIKNKEIQKQRFIQAGINQVHNMQKRNQQQRQKKQQKLKAEFKQALQKQIKQKQQQRYSLRVRNKSQPYTINIYKNIHHPIYNPVDFKMAHDNKLILRELGQERQSERLRSEEREGSSMSGLARKGSMILMPSYKAYN